MKRRIFAISVLLVTSFWVVPSFPSVGSNCLDLYAAAKTDILNVNKKGGLSDLNPTHNLNLSSDQLKLLNRVANLKRVEGLESATLHLVDDAIVEIHDLSFTQIVIQDGRVALRFTRDGEADQGQVAITQVPLSEVVYLKMSLIDREGKRSTGYFSNSDEGTKGNVNSPRRVESFETNTQNLKFITYEPAESDGLRAKLVGRDSGEKIIYGNLLYNITLTSGRKFKGQIGGVYKVVDGGGERYVRVFSQQAVEMIPLDNIVSLSLLNYDTKSRRTGNRGL